MKSKHQMLLAWIMLVSLSQSANATIWRVNLLSNYNGSTQWGENFGGTAGYPVFKQLFGNTTNSANSSSLVQAGDTVYLEGSTNSYEGGSLAKRLTIIGAGFFLLDNPNTSNDLLEARLDEIVFNPGSQGSLMIGVHVISVYGIDIGNVSNITIKRCKIDYDVYIGYNNSDIAIIGNFFSNPTANTGSAIDVSVYGFPVNFIFNNNISQRTLLLNSGATIYSVLECKNNVFDCPALSAGNPSIRLLCNNFQNNILKTPGAAVSVNNNIPGSGVSYNISASAVGQFGTANNNIVVVNQTTLFATSSSADAKYQLKPLSPGSNNGSDGTDRGAFGGLSINNQYTLSGLAPIPVIYDISTSGVADATGLPVTIKARTIK